MTSITLTPAIQLVADLDSLTPDEHKLLAAIKKLSSERIAKFGSKKGRPVVNRDMEWDAFVTFSPEHKTLPILRMCSLFEEKTSIPLTRHVALQLIARFQAELPDLKEISESN